MKFRTIYILFNIVIAVSFVFVFLLPFVLLGWDYSVEFWKGSWYLALFFLALLGILNAFFAWNWKVFSLVEKEDWRGLSAHLAERVFARRRYGGRQVALLVDAYLLLGDVEGIEALEEELRARRPSLLRKAILLFGLTRLLRDRPAEAEALLGPLVGARDVDDAEWLRFDYAFALVLQRKTEAALPHLAEAAQARDPVLALVAAYLLASVAPGSRDFPGGEAAAIAAAERTREALSKRFPGESFAREIERARGKFQVVVLSRLIEDALAWLRGAPAAGGRQKPKA